MHKLKLDRLRLKKNVCFTQHVFMQFNIIPLWSACCKINQIGSSGNYWKYTVWAIIFNIQPALCEKNNILRCEIQWFQRNFVRAMCFKYWIWSLNIYRKTIGLMIIMSLIALRSLNVYGGILTILCWLDRVLSMQWASQPRRIWSTA